MDFDTSKEEAFRRRLREFLQKEIEPHVAELDQKADFPWLGWNALKKRGMLGYPIPKKWGGAGGSFLEYSIALEEVSRVWAALGTSHEVHITLCQESINTFGSDELKEKYVKPLARGDAIGAFALTEPNAGTDAASIETSARLLGDKWALNGRKYFITNAPVADTFVIFAMTDRSMGTRGMSAFVVPRRTHGFKVGKLFHKMGIRASQTAELIMEDVHIPRENLINEEGEGFTIAMKILDMGRIGIAAQAVGIAQAALDHSVQYATRREQFGRPISNLQAIQWMVAEMSSQIEAARLLTYKAACCAETQEVFSKEAAMAKLRASDAAVNATRSAIQIHGGYGYMADLPLERLYRDAKITEIYEGTSEVQKMVIANALMR